MGDFASNNSHHLRYKGNESTAFVGKNTSADQLFRLIVPKKGLQIPLNDSTYNLYKSLFSNSENVPILKIKGKFKLYDKEITTYVFNQDYYFMMGDNRNHSLDSRNFGFVATDLILARKICLIRLSN